MPPNLPTSRGDAFFSEFLRLSYICLYLHQEKTYYIWMFLYITHSGPAGFLCVASFRRHLQLWLSSPLLSHSLYFSPHFIQLVWLMITQLLLSSEIKRILLFLVLCVVLGCLQKRGEEYEIRYLWSFFNVYTNEHVFFFFGLIKEWVPLIGFPMLNHPWIPMIKYTQSGCGFIVLGLVLYCQCYYHFAGLVY